jgi:hypothetical protein
MFLGGKVMKRLSIICYLLLISSGLFAQEAEFEIQPEAGGNKMAVAGGPEWNMNSRENFAVGVALAFDYNFGSSFAAGVNATFSTNFFGIVVIEPAALFRWYFLGSSHAGFFAQAETGVYLVFEDDEFTPLFLGGLRGGLRLPFGETLFVEPFGRIGYPFAFGFGVLAGVRF